jgi:hypothetical protein
MRHPAFILSVALAAATLLMGCRNEPQVAQNDQNAQNSKPQVSQRAELTVPSGTSIDVTLNTRLTSETANVGDAWSGSTRTASMVDGHEVIPAGSAVVGTVTASTPAHKGDRAMLDLALASVTVGGHNYHVRGNTEPVIAGSTRARNLGAIAGAAAVGAIVGHAIGGSTKGTVIGAVVGGGTATGVVSQTKGYQVVLKEGTPLTFTTGASVAVRI